MHGLLPCLLNLPLVDGPWVPSFIHSLGVKTSDDCVLDCFPIVRLAPVVFLLDVDVKMDASLVVPISVHHGWVGVHEGSVFILTRSHYSLSILGTLPVGVNQLRLSFVLLLLLSGGGNLGSLVLGPSGPTSLVGRHA